MMTNEAAIAFLKDIDSRYPCSLESTFRDECEQIALNMAVQALNTQESLQKKIEFLMNERHGEWTPVSEGLPNKNKVYNVTRIIDGTRITDACYFDGQNTWHRDTGVNHGRPYLTDIIAWQELPEPYKEGGEEE